MSVLSLLVCLFFISSLCCLVSSTSTGLRVLSAYCTPIDIYATPAGKAPVLLAASLNCSDQSTRVLFNATCTVIFPWARPDRNVAVRIELVDSLNNDSLANYEVVLESPQCSIIVFNDTLLRAPSYVLVSDTEEDTAVSLGMDTAQVRFVGVADLSLIVKLEKLHLLGRSTQCFDCLADDILSTLVYVVPSIFYVDTRWQYDLFMSNYTGAMVTREWKPMAQLRQLYREHAHYTLVATLSPAPAIYLFLDRSGASTFRPLWYAIAFFGICCSVWAVGYNLYKIFFVPRCCDLWDWAGELVRLRENARPKAAVALQSPLAERRYQRYRMHGLDACYWIFRGSVWNGLTFSDLAIPMLMLAMGVAMAFTIDVYAENPRNFLPLLFKISKRTATLYMFGLAGLLNSDEKHFRYFGPLQQFGITYWLTSVILIFVPRFRPGMPRVVDEELPLLNNHNDSSLHSVFIGIRPYIFQWLLVILIAMLHPLLSLYLPVPGCPTGYLGAGGIGDYGQYSNCTGGAVVYIDKCVLGINHLYPYPTCREVSGLAFGDGGLYRCTELEPQGILSFCTMILLVFIGVQLGRFVRLVRSNFAAVARMLAMAALMIGAALALCEASQNGGFIPVNKNLNSLSYVLLSGGLGILLLTLSYLFIDVGGLWNGGPFRYPGYNAVSLGILAEIVQLGWPFNWQPIPQHANILVMNITSCVIFALIAYWAFLHDDWRLVA